MLELVKSNDPILRAQCQAIELFPIDHKLINDMFTLMEQHNGCGLAAPQFGLDKQLFVIQRDDKRWVFTNSKIIEYGKRTEKMQEMCLSLPQISGIVTRSRKIKVEYQDENGNLIKATFDGLMARIFQHEFDHTQGILFTDYLK